MVTSYGYDGDRRLNSTQQTVSTTDPGPSGANITPYTPQEGGPSTVTTEATTYNSTGQVDYTTDEFGRITRTSYDANGDVVRTLYPDNTEVREVLDADGRVVWMSDRYATTTNLSSHQEDNTTSAPATHTTYDVSGRVVSTERYAGVIIQVNETALGNSTVYSTSQLEKGQSLATNQTVYNSAGQVAETISPSGLRTGSLYYPNGQLEYQGILASGAPSDWFTQGNPTSYFATDGNGNYEFSTFHYNQLDSNGRYYDSITDPLKNLTKTYKDGLGRTVLTVHATAAQPNTVLASEQTLYGVGGNPIQGHVVQGQTISGYQEAQIDANNQETDYFYNLAGQLTDVYLPPVVDPTASGSGSTPVQPHWQYTYDVSVA